MRDPRSTMPAPSSFTVLGSGGGPSPTPGRGYPAHLLMAGEDPILIDCGEGAITGLKRAGIEMARLQHIVLSHHHFDHIGSLFAILGVNMMTHRQNPLHIYGPPGTAQIVEGLFLACDVPNQTGFGATDRGLPHPRRFVSVTEITPGDVIEIGSCRVTCCENTHYRPETEFGQPGPLSLSLRFDLPDRSVVFTGDTGPCTGVSRLASGVDLLVGEMVDAEYVMDRVRRNRPDAPAAMVAAIRAHMEEHHLTAEQLGEMAKAAGAKSVVAVHLTSDATTGAGIHAFRTRIESRFEGRVVIAGDGESF
ncbi:MBL fold metallo-hydrolase [Nioella sp.]|uniref:MBL fold metallo-hydrolase n=1 Tax=Nioella sp. TaxID=1912091 RepID=UPI0035115911